MKQSRKQTNNRRGFSILELLLVLVILGVLAGIVATRFTGTSEKAKITAAGQQINNIAGALTRYEIAIGQYPTTQEGLKALTERPSSAPEEDWERFMEQTIVKDPWGNDYVYRYPGEHNNDYDLFSYGPDGKEGGDDDITNWSEEDE